ncbi:hypothetical protein [Lactiplantibacillus daowaiensis]|uniref:Uncharacterized protein n=1 Tax=Lactiplantibacillus daowaiensis TaxID=2559918 RepID=A0ABW1S082_9LACO|nr:hypothetical protein [Lactiplantibacillus daowaiensis]
MKKRRGTILLSVLSFILIFSAFETYRYLNYVQRQQVYHALIYDYQHPAAMPVQKSTKSHRQDSKKSSNSSRGKDSVSAHRQGSRLN